MNRFRCPVIVTDIDAWKCCSFKKLFIEFTDVDFSTRLKTLDHGRFFWSMPAGICYFNYNKNGLAITRRLNSLFASVLEKRNLNLFTRNVDQICLYFSTAPYKNEIRYKRLKSGVYLKFSQSYRSTSARPRRHFENMMKEVELK